MAVFLRRVSSLGTVASNPFLAPKQLCKAQAAGMISNAMQDKDYKRPIPYPYEFRPYNLITSFFDQTTWRFEENSKIIVVDGPFASGKDKIARKIAKEFDLHYIPHANIAGHYINSYGFDTRVMDHKLPFKCKSFDSKDFLTNPNDERAAIHQINFFSIRFRQYLDALTHVFSTGQGVVMNRSVYSDFVFLETYMKFGFLPKTYKKLYYMTWNCLWPELLKPHLVVYLDTPVQTVLDNIKKRGRKWEMNSPVYRPEVLVEMERIYKHKFLKDISTHAELLVYDCPEELDTEMLVEDIERMNLDDYPKHDDKMHDWRAPVDEQMWTTLRINFTRDRWILERWLANIPYWDCPEIILSGEDSMQRQVVQDNTPGERYAPGFNADMGDANLLWKWQ